MPSMSFVFSEEEINNMKSELEKYNIQMPAFSKIGGILANELSVDEAACEFFSLSKVKFPLALWHRSFPRKHINN